MISWGLGEEGGGGGGEDKRLRVNSFSLTLFGLSTVLTTSTSVPRYYKPIQSKPHR